MQQQQEKEGGKGKERGRMGQKEIFDSQRLRPERNSVPSCLEASQVCLALGCLRQVLLLRQELQMHLQCF